MKARTLPTYDKLLCGSTAHVGWLQNTLLDTVKNLADSFDRLQVADFGCGVGVSLLSLVAQAQAAGLSLTGLGVDKGFKNSPDGLFPDTPDALQVVLERYAADIYGPCAGHGLKPGAHIPVKFMRADLSADGWPLEAMIVHLAMSSKTVMFFRDKLRFLERVWRSLVLGGVAVIEMDVGLPGGIGGDTPRIATPLPFADLLERERRKGREISASLCPLSGKTHRAGVVASESDDQCLHPKQSRLMMSSYVITMRRNLESELRFGLSLKGCTPFEPGIKDEDWGIVSHYDFAQSQP